MGLDGTGKSTVVHLASYIAGCEIMRLKLHKHYSMLEFRDDLKTVFKQSGVRGINTVFLLADSDIVKVITVFLLFSVIVVVELIGLNFVHSIHVDKKHNFEHNILFLNINRMKACILLLFYGR